MNMNYIKDPQQNNLTSKSLRSVKLNNKSGSATSQKPSRVIYLAIAGVGFLIFVTIMLIAYKLLCCYQKAKTPKGRMTKNLYNSWLFCPFFL